MNQACARHANETVQMDGGGGGGGGEGGGLVLQALWDRMREHQPLLSSPLFPAVSAFLAHVLLCAPFFVLDSLQGCAFCRRIGLCRLDHDDRRSRNNNNPPPAARVMRRRWLDCLRRIVWNYLYAVLPVTALFQRTRASSALVPDLAPSCWRLCVEVIACLLVFDALFYAWHYALHRFQWLYQNVHQVHHHNQTPFALAAQDASSAELLSLLLLALGSARLVGSHPLSEAMFHVLNSWLAVEDHCGYDLPWSLHRLLPCLGGAPYHQAHHRLFRGNYAPYFTHWDHVFGTQLESG